MTTTGADDLSDPSPNSPRDEEAVAHFVENFADVMTQSGMPRMPSRVMACLMAADGGALTAAELAEQLKISAAAVSGAIRYLSQLRLVTRGRQPGTRRDLYRVQHNVWYQSFIASDQLLAGWLDTMAAGVAAVGGADTDAGGRLSESADFLQFLINDVNGILDRWNRHREQQLAEAADRGERT